MQSVVCSAVGCGPNAFWSLWFGTVHVGPVATNDRGWWLGKALGKQNAGTEK